jgi:hypothetical protein
MSRILRVAPLLLALSLASAGMANATSLPILCNLDYYVSTGSASLSATPRDRVCAVQVIFSNGGGTTSRTYSCTVATGQTSCSLTVNPAASSVPSGFTPQSASTAPLYSSTEEDAGCVYDAGYPSAQISTMMGTTSLTVHHRFDCTSTP